MQVIKVMFVINFIIDIRKYFIENNILLVMKLLIVITILLEVLAKILVNKRHARIAVGALF